MLLHACLTGRITVTAASPAVQQMLVQFQVFLDWLLRHSLHNGLQLVVGEMQVLMHVALAQIGSQCLLLCSFSLFN
jgi:hypothetical protein